MKSMKLVIAYIRTEFAEDLMRELYSAGIGGITCYMVHGMSSEKQSFLYMKHPFEVDHLPASLKLEVVCTADSVDRIVSLFARIARTRNRGDGVIAVQDIENVQRIRDVVS
jgi:nitrogen regulatory protein PII